MDRALIIKKPWIDLILDGQKTWEMRTRKTKIKGIIGLIEQGTGLIVGQANLIDGTFKPTTDELIKNAPLHRVENLEILETWCYRWELREAHRFKTPIPYKHPKGAVIWVTLKQ